MVPFIHRSVNNNVKPIAARVANMLQGCGGFAILQFFSFDKICSPDSGKKDSFAFEGIYSNSGLTQASAICSL